MKAYKAEDLRSFTQALFTRDSFDPFLVLEAEFRTYCLFSVRGNTERGWYTDEELETEQVSENTFVVTIEVSLSPTFYAWVFQSGGDIKIAEPEWVKDEFNDMLAKQMQ